MGIHQARYKLKLKEQHRCLRCTKPNDRYPMTYCSDCVVKQRAWYWKNREKVLLKSAKRAGDPTYQARKRQLDQEYRRMALVHYGGDPPRCSCCGETIEEFLTIDHVNGAGNKHRKELGYGGSSFFRWLVRNNFPLGFRVLCMNCNWGARLTNGICPHTLKVNLVCIR